MNISINISLISALIILSSIVIVLILINYLKDKKKFVTAVNLLFGNGKYPFDQYPYISLLEKELKERTEVMNHYKGLWQGGIEIIKVLEDKLDTCQHENTDSGMTCLNLRNALNDLIEGCVSLPPLTAINGMLTEQVKNARQAVKDAEHSLGWYNDLKEKGE